MTNFIANCNIITNCDSTEFHSESAEQCEENEKKICNIVTHSNIKRQDRSSPNYLCLRHSFISLFPLDCVFFFFSQVQLVCKWVVIRLESLGPSERNLDFPPPYREIKFRRFRELQLENHIKAVLCLFAFNLSRFLEQCLL